MEQTPDNKQWRWQQRWNLEQDLAAIGRLIDRPLWVKIIIAMFLGLGLGIAISPQGGQLLPEASALSIAGWLKLPGSIFLNMIQMVVIPLIISSIILGVASSGDPAYLRRVGLRIFPYFISTTIIAVTIGIFLASSIEPGQYIDAAYLQQFIQQGQAAAPTAAAPPQSLPERISSLVPANISAAQLNKDMLQIVIYALFFAVAIVALPSQRRQPLLSLLESIQDACLKLIGWAMLLAPYAVFGLLADIAIRVGLNAMLGVSAYMGTVVLGLLLLLCLYVLVAWALAKQPPLKFLNSIRSAQLLAFSTSSSAAVMPLSMQIAQDKLAVRPAISKFIIPLGATINMDGTALYQVVAAIFLAQVYGVDLSYTQIALLSATTVGASIGSPSTPGVGIAILATILADIGIPASGIALIIGVDRLLDMCRTTINVTGDLTACTVMNSWLPDQK